MNDGTDTLYELIDGQVVAMPRTSDAHGTSIANLVLAIGPQLTPPCRIVGNAGIYRPERADSYYIADLAVTCDRPPDQRFFLPEPRLIVEVLSRSTAAHDRGRKGEEYRQSPASRRSCSRSATSGGSSCGAVKESAG